MKTLLFLLASLMCLSAIVIDTDATAKDDDRLVIYCGRSKALVEPLIDRFRQETGMKVEVRYAGSTELANLLVEEGRRSPADLFFSQDPGATGAVEAAGLLGELPSHVLESVDRIFRSQSGNWVGVSGRARVFAHSTERVNAENLPETVFGFTDPRWAGRVGWAPTNASFHMFVSAMRATHGDAITADWLRAMKANGVKDYSNNRAAIQGVADGEVDVSLVNHYYLKGFLDDRGESFPVRNHRPEEDLGGMVSVASVGVLRSARHPDAARRFVEFLLTTESQSYFEQNTGEYRLVANGHAGQLRTVDVDLASLTDLRGTMDLLRAAGVLP
jgi:iron(III) transport system substrate-binding protein